MNHTLQGYFQNLKINKFFSKCLAISDTNNVVQFNMDFNKTPEVFVSVNQFIITYEGSGDSKTKDGTLVKKDLKWKHEKDKIVFESRDIAG